MTTMAAASPASLLSGAWIQGRVVGALIMRELHTRFGRDNIGYLWLFLEPALLSLIIAVLHIIKRGPLPWGMQMVPFYVSGYTIHCAFRFTINRSSSTLQANSTLLYHRHVTIMDLILSRSILDCAATMVAGLVIMLIASAFEFGDLPQRPLIFLGAWALNLWFCTGLAMLVVAGSVVYPGIDKFTHPLTYLALPLSNCFTIYEQLPPIGKYFLIWFPQAQIGEMTREGVFAHFNSPLTKPLYVMGWCAALTFLGFFALRAVRPKVILE